MTGLWESFREMVTGRCRFVDKAGVCRLHGYRCSDPTDYYWCGKWKDEVLGPVERPSGDAS